MTSWESRYGAHVIFGPSSRYFGLAAPSIEPFQTQIQPSAFFKSSLLNFVLQPGEVDSSDSCPVDRFFFRTFGLERVEYFSNLAFRSDCTDGRCVDHVKSRVAPVHPLRRLCAQTLNLLVLEHAHLSVLPVVSMASGLVHVNCIQSANSVELFELVRPLSTGPSLAVQRGGRGRRSVLPCKLVLRLTDSGLF